MAAVGARNLITEDHTRTTVVLAERPAVTAVDFRGGAPGTR
jgi:L-aminopeptidase/D-esterase-like protein